MLTLDTVNKQAIDRAITRAKAEKPLVVVLGNGIFNVAASNGQDWYSVYFDTNAAGETVGSCDCPAHTKKQSAILCKHITACYPIYQQQNKSSAQLAEDEPDLISVAPKLAKKPEIICYRCKARPARVNGLCVDCVLEDEAAIYG